MTAPSPYLTVPETKEEILHAIGKVREHLTWLENTFDTTPETIDTPLNWEFDFHSDCQNLLAWIWFAIGAQNTRDHLRSLGVKLDPCSRKVTKIRVQKKKKKTSP